MSSYSSSDVEKLVKLDWARRAGELCWFHAELNAWLTTVASGSESWIGWSAVTAIGITLSRWQPWTAVCDASEKPFVRWFCNATTSAAFNELDRAALLGLAEDCAFVAEPLDGSASILSLRKLLLQATLAASAVRDELQIGTNDRVALYIPNHPQVRKLACGMSQKQGCFPAFVRLTYKTRALRVSASYHGATVPWRHRADNLACFLCCFPSYIPLCIPPL